MVVVLAAVCAYRYHRSKQQAEQQQDGEALVVKVEKTTSTTTLSEHWQRTTEPLRRSSSDLVRTAFACHLPTETTTTEQEHESALDWRPPRTSRSTTGSQSTRRSSRRKHQKKHVILPKLSNNNIMVKQYAAQVFQHDVRQRWIDAVFGSDFCKNNNSSFARQGTGNAGIASYVTYSCTIPILEKDSKLGLTLSKLALGLYVRKTAAQSEAQSAGIVEGSILVSVNQSMSLLGEPSKQALERMWQYEGLLENTTSAKKKSEPISLTFYHPQGHLYTVVLLTSPFGISWAPCGHFALVQRVYGAAQTAGVRRGSLVAAIQDSNYSLRELTDHVDWGMRLQEYNHAELKMTFCYPPAASRSSHYERQQQEAGSSGVNQTKKSQLPGRRTDDGIELRVHPLEYSIRSLWTNSSPTSAGGGSPKSTDESVEEEQPNSITELARQVVMGQVLAPTKRQEALQTKRFASDKRYSSCPPFPGIVQAWNALDALVYCLRSYKASYHDVLEPTSESPLTTLERIGTKTCQPFLLSCVGLLCQPDDDSDTSFAEYGEKVMAVLLTIALGDEDFCQRLHFVLRSFCRSLENNTLLSTARQRLAKQMANDPTRVPVTPPRRVRVTSSVSEEEGVESINVQDTGSAIPIQSEPQKKKKGVFSKLKRKGKKKGAQEEEPSVATAPSQNNEDVKKSSIFVAKPVQPEYHSLPALLENATQFVSELDNICDTIEMTLLRSISQKIADWALQPWSPGKETVLAEVTHSMREDLVSKVSKQMPSMNPVDSSEVLVSLDPEGCYILPSAHFPLLLTLNVERKSATRSKRFSRPEEKLYRTKVEILGLRGAGVASKNPRQGVRRSYFVGASVAGAVKETRRSVTKDESSGEHFWDQAGALSFDSRSSWGAPQTLSLRLSSVDTDSRGRDVVSHADEFGALSYSSDLGYCWIDLKPLWDKAEAESRSATSARRIRVFSDDSESDPQPFELQIKVTTEYVVFNDSTAGHPPRQRMLLYKHDDDLRQEMFAVEFVRTCDALLKASGLDLRLLTFECVPVGEQRGFVEWIPGSVPLSELCRSPLSDSEVKGSAADKKDVATVEQSLSEVARAGFSKYQPLRRPRRAARSGRLPSDNTIQDFLRSVAYDPNEPYLIQKEIMDTYIRSCAGYCVISYVLGVGDRHLDNLLLHQTGHFFHCDFSFLLGRDPKKYLPMRITEAMIDGMGGKDSDGYAMFSSLAGAAFCVLRRHENVRVMLSLVRTLASASLPDVSVQQTVDQATQSMMDRLRLDLSDDDAITFIEETIETSISSKMWLAVDAIHSIGKRL